MYRAKKSLIGLVFSIILFTCASSFSRADNGLFTAIEKVPLPTEVGAQEASLTSKDGILYMTWMERVNTQTKVMFSMKTASGWSEPTAVHIGYDLFVNWADFPSIAILSDKTIAVH